MRDFELQKLWNRLVDGLHWLGWAVKVPFWVTIGAIDAVWEWVYEFFTGLVPTIEESVPTEDELHPPVPATSSQDATGVTEKASEDPSWFEPIRLTLELAGAIHIWFVSRPWLRLSAWAVPSFIVALAAMIIAFAGDADRTRLARRYIDLGLSELADWEQAFELSPQARQIAVGISNSNSSAGSSSPPNAFEIGGENLASVDHPAIRSTQNRKISPYAELLFRRAQLLMPQKQSTYIIGAALIQNGSVDAGRRMLRRVSPDNAVGMDKGHAMLAASYLEEYLVTYDQRLLPLFEHHANISALMPNTPAEVMLIASELHWKAGRRQTAMELLEVASQKSAAASLRLVKRAADIGDPRLVSTARNTALQTLLRLLADNPKNALLRAEAAMLMGTDPEELKRAEQLLREGLKIGPSRILSRALSEVHRIDFLQQMTNPQTKVINLKILDKAFAADPTNPLVADVMSDLVVKANKSSPQFKSSLDRILISGEATMVTHTLMAELHLFLDREKDATVHLEQVHALFPSAIKYAWLLTRSYAKEFRWEEAEQVATVTLDLLEAKKLLTERYCGDLLELLAEIYEQTNRQTKAVEVLNRLLSVDPARVSGRQKLMHLHRALGNEIQAQEQQVAIQRIEAEKALPPTTSP
ncbi:MAG: hypothetical protein KF752_00120 [Pirellulaceae bacterium]|nr:hypothetical protein [Pirellulaceae bacterium]